MHLSLPRSSAVVALLRTAVKIVLPVWVSLSVVTWTVRADSPSPGIDPGVAAKLNERITELERKAKRVDELEAEVKALKAAAASAEAPSPVTAPEVYPKVRMDILTDLTYHVSNREQDFNTFALGDVDAVITAQISEDASVLSDFVVASNHGGFAFEIERLILQYRVNEYLNLQAGRFHTAIGYYNNVYHNGTYFQTATERPEIYLFEDGEGILPIHSNGISVNGDIPSGTLRLHYVAEIANGRNYTSDVESFEIEDDNDFKALNFALSARPEGVAGLQFGGSVYHDLLTPPGLPRTNQLILSAYVVYKNTAIEWLNEYVFLRNKPQGGEAFDTSAVYTQISKKFDKIRPYARLQWRKSPVGDPVLALIGQNVTVWGPTLGIRYDFTPMMALKGEYQHSERSGESNLDEFTMQWTTRF